MFGQLTYLVFELCWAMPVLILQWAVGWRTLWRVRRRCGAVWVLSTGYLMAADRFAIANGIWSINPPRVTGLTILGLPIEEAIFFAVTDLMVVQSFALLSSSEERGRIGFLIRRSRQLGETVRAGYALGVNVALVAAAFVGVVAFIGGIPSGLAPFTAIVVSLTPLPLATALLVATGTAGTVTQFLGSLGALAVFLLVGGVVGAARAVLGWAGGLVALAIAGGATYLFEPNQGVANLELLPFLMIVIVVRPDDIGRWGLRRGHADSFPAAGRIGPPAATAGIAPGSAQSSIRTCEKLSDPRGRVSRREALARSGRFVGTALATSGLAVARDRRDRSTDLSVARAVFERVGTWDGLALEQDTFGVSTLTPLVTRVGSFYRMSKNTEDPNPAVTEWSLEVAGFVRGATRLTYGELLALPAIDRYVTLECVDNPVGGPLMGTAYWTGVRVVDLVTSWGVDSRATRLVVVGADGEDEDIPLARLSEIDPLLAYGMNGEPLTRAHGFPLRLIVPGYYGFKHVKWVTRLELAVDGVGFWARRGWDSLPAIRSTARIDYAKLRSVGPGQVGTSVGGVALGGIRSVVGVEVRPVGGSWVEATLRLPAIGPAVWVPWKVVLPPPAADEVEARVVDSNGVVPAEPVLPPFPSGARGWTRKTVAR